MSQRAIALLTGADQWTDAVRLNGAFNLSISTTNTSLKGFLGGNVIVAQRKFSYTDGWRDVETFAWSSEEAGVEPENAYYRFGIPAGALYFSAFPILVRIGQEGGYSGRP